MSLGVDGVSSLTSFSSSSSDSDLACASSTDSLSSSSLDSTDTGEQKLAKINLRTVAGSFPADYFKFARSIQLRFTGVAATTFEINDISLVYKEKRLK